MVDLGKHYSIDAFLSIFLVMVTWYSTVGVLRFSGNWKAERRAEGNPRLSLSKLGKIEVTNFVKNLEQDANTSVDETRLSWILENELEQHQHCKGCICKIE